MNYKKHLDSVIRTNTVNAVRDAQIGHRLHAGERTTEFSKEQWEKFKSSLTQEDFINYPDSWELRVALANYHSVSVDNILLFGGASEAISCAVSCFTHPGAQVVMPEFHFPMYDVYCAQHECVPVYLKYQQLTLSNETHIPICNPELAIIANPNSPVGDSPSAELFEYLERFDIPIIVDSVYAEFGCTPLSLYEKLHKNYIFAHSFSKSFGGAGMRLGYIIANTDITSIMSKMMPMFSVTGPSIKFGLWALENKGEMKEYCEKIIAVRTCIQERYRWNIGGNWIHLPSAFYQNLLMDAGFTLKSNCFLPSVTPQKLIRVTVSLTLFECLKEYL